MLIFYIRDSTPKTRLSSASAHLSFFSALIFIYLSHMEHRHSVRPSNVLALFFFFTLLFDIPRARTLWAVPGLETISNVFVASMALKWVNFLLEITEKPSLVKDQYFDPAPETWSGIISRSLFLWFNPLLFKGSRKNLAMDDLYAAEASMVPDDSKRKDILEEYWEKSGMRINFLFSGLSSCLLMTN
jgi:ATP-binding cassette subfamily C (CFTR/MRP) protein 1